MSRLKTGGRAKGTPNKVTKDTRILIESLVKKEIAYITKNISKLSIKDRCYFLTRLLPYVSPKMLSVEQESTINQGQLVEVYFTSTDVKLPTSESEANVMFRDMGLIE